VGGQAFNPIAERRTPFGGKDLRTFVLLRDAVDGDDGGHGDLRSFIVGGIFSR